MPSHQNLAELRFSKPDFAVYGIVTQTQGEKLTLHLQTSPPAGTSLQPGMTAELTIIAKEMVYTVPSRVLSVEQDVVLSAAKPTIHAQRRANQRLRCTIPVSFRAFRPDGTSSVWQQGQVIDLSLGGMGIQFAAVKPPMGALEVKFMLPGSKPLSRGTVQKISDQGLEIADGNSEEDRPMNMVGRIAHSRFLSGGNLAVGLEFSRMHPFDQFRLLRFINAQLSLSISS